MGRPGPTAALFRFGSGVVLRVASDDATTADFVDEYGPARIADGTADPDVSVVFGEGQLDGAFTSAAVADGHKSVRWNVRLGDADSAVLQARIGMRGWPRSFGRSLVQGYIVEPLVSVAAARRETVLLPSAGIVGPDGLIVILGRSRAGKSTLAARSLALGFETIGDDQLLVAATGSVWPFPRRLRFYPDLEDAAPLAFRALRGRTRRRLRLRGLVARLSRGFVRPSLAVDATELGGTVQTAPRRPVRLILLDRRDVSGLVQEEVSLESAVEMAAELLVEQRSRLASVGGPDWRSAIAAAAARESTTLGQAFASISITRLTLPRAWPAAEAVAAVAGGLGLEPPRAT